MGTLRDGENRSAVGSAPGDTDNHDGTGRILQTPQTTPWATENIEELTLRDKPTSGRRLFPESLTRVAALVALGFGLYTAGVRGDRRMQENLDEVAAEQAEAEAEAESAETLRQLQVVESFLIQRVQTSAPGEERANAEQALADWRKDHPELSR